MFVGLLEVVLLILALITTFGLSFGVAGSLHTGKLKPLRSEENMIRFITVLGISVFDVFTIWPFVHILPLSHPLLAIILSCFGAIASWKMFSSGILRGQQLLGCDLRDTVNKLSDTLDSISKTGADIREDHKQNSEQIGDYIANISDKLELDQQIEYFARNSAKIEVKNTVNANLKPLQDYVDTILGDMKTKHEELSGKLDKNFQILHDFVGTSPNFKTESTDIKNDVTSKYIDSDVSSSYQPDSVHRNQKILKMISMDLSQYKPKVHKLCIAIHNLLKNRQNTSLSQSYLPNMSEISGISGVNKTDVKSRLQDLANTGLILMQKGSSSRIEFGFADKLDRLFNPILENQREGGMESFHLIQKAKEHYLESGNYVEILKQDIQIVQPDAVSIPRLDNDSFDISNANAIEIETPQEIRSHPKQVKFNMIKNLQWFSSVHVWCYDESKEMIQKIFDSLDVGQRIYIQIMTVQQDGSSS